MANSTFSTGSSSTIVNVASGTLTNATELIITDLSSNYRLYQFIFSGFTTDQTSTNFGARLSTDNGSTWINSAASYFLRILRASGGGIPNNYSGDVTYMQLINGAANDAANFISGNVNIFDPMDAGSRTTAIIDIGGGINADGNTNNIVVSSVTSQRKAVEANNAIRFFLTTDGVTEAGTFSMRYTLIGYVA